MKKVLHIGWCLVEVFIIAYVVVLTSFILHRNNFGFTQFRSYIFVNVSIWDIRTIANVKKNDLLIIKRNDSIKEGDLIYYYYVDNERYVVRSNKVFDIIDGSETTSYQIDDKEYSFIPKSRVIGTSATTISYLGGLLALLENRYGFIFLVLIPIIIVFGYQLYDFIITLKYERDEVINLENEIKETKEYYAVPVIEKVIEIKSNSFLDKDDDDIEIL